MANAALKFQSDNLFLSDEALEILDHIGEILAEEYLQMLKEKQSKIKEEKK